LENQTEYLTDNIAEEGRLERRKNKFKAQTKEKALNTEDILIKILNRLEKLEEARGTIIEGPTNHS